MVVVEQQPLTDGCLQGVSATFSMRKEETIADSYCLSIFFHVILELTIYSPTVVRLMSASVFNGLWQTGGQTGSWGILRWLWLVAAVLMSLSAQDVGLISPSGAENHISHWWAVCRVQRFSSGNSRDICYLLAPVVSVWFTFSAASNCVWKKAVQFSFCWQSPAVIPKEKIIWLEALLLKTISSVLLWFTVAKIKYSTSFSTFERRLLWAVQ